MQIVSNGDISHENFMQIVSNGDISHEMSNPVSWEK